MNRKQRSKRLIKLNKYYKSMKLLYKSDPHKYLIKNAFEVGYIPPVKDEVLK